MEEFESPEARKARADMIHNEIEKIKLKSLIEFVRKNAPPNMQQDEQDFEDWVRSDIASTYYLSWPRGERAKTTISCDIVKNTLEFSAKLTDEEAAPYKGFYDKLRELFNLGK